MCKIAKKLGAKVLGDEGEEYSVKLDKVNNETIKIESLLYREEEKPKSFFKRLLNLWK